MKLTVESKRSSIGTYMYIVTWPDSDDPLECGGWYMTELRAFEEGLKAARSRAAQLIKGQEKP